MDPNTSPSPQEPQNIPPTSAPTPPPVQQFNPSATPNIQQVAPAPVTPTPTPVVGSPTAPTPGPVAGPVALNGKKKTPLFVYVILGVVVLASIGLVIVVVLM